MEKEQAVDERSRQEVMEILQGESHYGTVEIQRLPVGHRGMELVEWVGRPGRSASVGMWLRLLHKWPGGIDLPVVRWKVQSGPVTMVYFGVTCTNPLAQFLWLVGGCTIGSGEGGRARQLVETYLAMRSLPVEDADPNQLIEMLVDLRDAET